MDTQDHLSNYQRKHGGASWNGIVRPRRVTAAVLWRTQDSAAVGAVGTAPGRITFARSVRVFGSAKEPITGVSLDQPGRLTIYHSLVFRAKPSR